MKGILTLFFSVFTAICFAQENAMVEQYCEVVATGRLLSNKVTIDVDYGDQRSIWKDHRLKNDDGRLQKFNSVIDAINFLGQQGWSLVNAFPVATANNPMVYHYVFKKQFTKAEVAQ